MKWPRRFDFVALTVGAVTPDVFEPYFNLAYNDAIYNLQRDLTHSLFGALTLDFVVALLGTVLIVRPLLRWMNRRWPSGLWSGFANQDFLARRPCPITLVSVWLGTLSHVLIDVPFHAAFRLFAPFAPDSWVFDWRMQPLADVASTVLFGPLFGYLLYMYWWRPSRQVREAGASRARAN
jgi:membrane-bound metal-dependent hydrolase YbcI (DUF457 family)